MRVARLPVTCARAGAALLAALLVIGAVGAAQQAQPEAPLPRFRAGTNLVRLDAYVSANGQAVIDLTADDFEVFEDDAPQKVEGFELVRARGEAAPTTLATTPASTREQLEAARDPNARIFVLYLDLWHVGIDGSARAPKLVATFLEKVVGPNDLVGLMTPEITPDNMTLTRRGAELDRMLSQAWTWGQRGQLNTVDPREQDYQACYPDAGSTAGIAREMIERRREQKVLRSIDATIAHLDGIREERKFVVLLSNGWVQFRQNDQLARVLRDSVAAGTPIVSGVGGRVSTQDPGNAVSGLESCERDRVMLAYIDHQLVVRQMAQRANRANVSFYPVDPRGLTAFDGNITDRFTTLTADNARLQARQDGLRVLAEQTDGAWVLNTNDTGGALARILADTGSYYLLSYYSTNGKLDGRFRRITVRVKRPDVEVRARPGYLAPTEAEARAAGAALTTPGVVGAKPPTPASVTRALDSIIAGRAVVPLRIQATGLADRIRAVIEVDATTLKQPEWQTGGTFQVTVESEKGGSARTLSVSLAAGQRSVTLEGPDEALDPGRYIVRAEGRPSKGAALRASTDAVVGPAGATISTSGVASRRGPTTGLAYQPTADPRFRRTERLRVEIPVLASGAVAATGRVLTREGQPLPLQVVISERTDQKSAARFLLADVTLAPLAQGEFVLEVSAGKELVSYGFRIVP